MAHLLRRMASLKDIHLIWNESTIINGGRCNSNSASAAINKWIKTAGGSSDVIHGLRHSFRDRLRAVEAPTDMIDQLGGWALKSVGQGYGDGYYLELLVKYLQKVAAVQSPTKFEGFNRSI